MFKKSNGSCSFHPHFKIFISYIVLSILVPECCTIEPITTSVAALTAVGMSAVFVNYDRLKCSFYECCDKKWVSPNITHLGRSFDTQLHGQHLVKDLVIKSVQAHTKPGRNPSKALVLSFHGWTGGGKNFVSRIVAESLYREGMDSKFVHLFMATLHFAHQERIETYKDQLRDWVKGNVSLCTQSMFIFDEMDKMPTGLLDTIKPYLDYHPEINGVDYRRSIFIFLSNTGGSLITKKTMSMWESGVEREAIELKHVEGSIMQGAFNEEGGLWHSSLIEKNLVDAFVPFLPLERKHIKMCIKDDLEAKHFPVTEEILSRVADELQYFPPGKKLYSKSGCKRVSQKVDLVMEEIDS